MVEPVFVILLATITAIVAGMVAGGPELLPGSVFQVPAQVAIPAVFSKPLKLEGALPPESVLLVAHCDPQKLTFDPTAGAGTLPMTKTPPAGNGIRVLVMVQVPGFNDALQVPAGVPLAV